MKKMSFIGTGVMGSAIAKAACEGNDPADIVVTDYDKEKAKRFAEEHGACFAQSNAEAVRMSKYILIGVKPQVGESVLSEIGPVIKECIENGEEKVLVSIMVSVSIDTIKKWLGVDVDLPIIRTLPNVAASVGKCITLCTNSSLVSDEIFEEYINLDDKNKVTFEQVAGCDEEKAERRGLIPVAPVHGSSRSLAASRYLQREYCCGGDGD